jgi:phosphoserine phosphatase
MATVHNIAIAAFQTISDRSWAQASVEPIRVSVFDLDRTLTRHGTWSPFLLFAARRLAPWRLVLVPAVLICMAAYKAGLISRDRLKELMQWLMIGSRVAGNRIRPIATAFAKRQLDRNCYMEGFAAIAAEKSEGRLIMLATAAQRFYAEPLAAELAIDLVVATESRWDGDTLLARIDGRNCRSVEKRDRIAQALGQFAYDRDRLDIRFFSDDASDQPSFEWADEAIAVNPQSKMRKLARKCGWPMLHWKQ